MIMARDPKVSPSSSHLQASRRQKACMAIHRAALWGSQVSRRKKGSPESRKKEGQPMASSPHGSAPKR